MANNQKSAIIFSPNTSEFAKQQVIQATRGSILGNFDRYLGLPALIGRSKYNSFRWIKERV